MTEDASAKEAVFGIFTSEMQRLSTEVNLLSSAVYAPDINGFYTTRVSCKGLCSRRLQQNVCCADLPMEILQRATLGRHRLCAYPTRSMST